VPEGEGRTPYSEYASSGSVAKASHDFGLSSRSEHP